jgi:hypothetical protein
MPGGVAVVQGNAVAGAPAGRVVGRASPAAGGRNGPRHHGGHLIAKADSPFPAATATDAAGHRRPPSTDPGPAKATWPG